MVCFGINMSYFTKTSWVLVKTNNSMTIFGRSVTVFCLSFAPCKGQERWSATAVAHPQAVRFRSAIGHRQRLASASHALRGREPRASWARAAEKMPERNGNKGEWHSVLGRGFPFNENELLTHTKQGAVHFLSMRTNSVLTPCKQGAVLSRYSIPHS